MESAKIYPLNRNGIEGDAAVNALATPPKPKLLDQVRQAIRTRHYSYRTEKAYVLGSNALSFSITNGIRRKWQRPRSLGFFQAWRATAT